MNKQRASPKHLIALAGNRNPDSRDVLINDLTDLFAGDASTLSVRPKSY